MKPSPFPMKPTETVARLRAVGTELFGKKWKTAMAERLGVSRPTVNSWDWGRYAPGEAATLDRKLLSVLKAENDDAAERRGAMISALEKVVGKNA